MEYRGKGGFSRGGGRGKGNAGQVWGGGATATWSVQQMEDREWGKASGLLGFRGPARPHAPPSLTRASAAAGRAAGRRTASSSRVVLDAARRSLFLPSRAPPGRGQCAFSLVEGWGRVGGVIGYGSR